MIRVFGVVMISSYSQTLNMYKDFTYVTKVLSKINYSIKWDHFGKQNDR